MEKRAQNISITTIILIIIGLVVLVLLILGFTMGWGRFKEWIVPSNNIQTIVDQCNIACSTGQKYNYCFEKKELKTKEETLDDVSCYSLAKKRPDYGIKTCPAIDCGILDNVDEEDVCLNKKAGEKVWYLDGVSLKEKVCGTENNPNGQDGK